MGKQQQRRKLDVTKNKVAHTTHTQYTAERKEKN